MLHRGWGIAITSDATFHVASIPLRDTGMNDLITPSTYELDDHYVPNSAFAPGCFGPQLNPTCYPVLPYSLQNLHHHARLAPSIATGVYGGGNGGTDSGGSSSGRNSAKFGTRDVECDPESRTKIVDLLYCRLTG